MTALGQNGDLERICHSLRGPLSSRLELEPPSIATDGHVCEGEGLVLIGHALVCTPHAWGWLMSFSGPQPRARWIALCGANAIFLLNVCGVWWRVLKVRNADHDNDGVEHPKQ